MDGIPDDDVWKRVSIKEANILYEIHNNVDKKLFATTIARNNLHNNPIFAINIKTGKIGWFASKKTKIVKSTPASKLLYWGNK